MKHGAVLEFPTRIVLDHTIVVFHKLLGHVRHWWIKFWSWWGWGIVLPLRYSFVLLSRTSRFRNSREPGCHRLGHLCHKVWLMIEHGEHPTHHPVS